MRVAGSHTQEMTMSGMTHTETVGFLKAVTEFMTKNGVTLSGLGFAADAKAQELRTLLDTLVSENATQEGMKSQLVKQTKVVESVSRQAYTTGSGMVDAMAGFLGKTTPEAKALARLRSDVRAGSKAAKAKAATN
jgi:hypothetical protein